MNFYQGPFKSPGKSKTLILDKIGSKKHTVLIDAQGCDPSIKNYSFRYGLWCDVLLPVQTASLQWNVKVIGKEEGICWGKGPASWIRDPWGEKLSGFCMTCCHVIRLVGLHRKTPLSIGPLLHVWPERSTETMSLGANKGSSINSGHKLGYINQKLDRKWEILLRKSREDYHPPRIHFHPHLVLNFCFFIIIVIW